VSKDDDFHRLSFASGPPPKVIALMLGNCSTEQIESLMRGQIDQIRSFDADHDASILVLK
jgi:predicted nuclease of predicted toxin-antitoxin system